MSDVVSDKQVTIMKAGMNGIKSVTGISASEYTRYIRLHNRGLIKVLRGNPKTRRYFTTEKGQQILKDQNHV